MLILTWKLRPNVFEALTAGVQEAERVHEVAMSIRQARDIEAVRRDFAIASLVVADLSQIALQDAVNVLSGQLEAHPFVQVDVISGPCSTASDLRTYFDLGRAGLQQLHLPQEANDSSFWARRLCQFSNFDLVGRILHEMDRRLREVAPGEFLSKVLEFHAAASVKTLAEKMYPGKKHTAAYKRRLLWQQCKSLGLSSPEHVLSALRLRVLKGVLDANVWTYDRVARHFGYDTARNLNRACKTRYGLSVTNIRQATLAQITELATNIFLTSATPPDNVDN